MPASYRDCRCTIPGDRVRLPVHDTLRILNNFCSQSERPRKLQNLTITAIIFNILKQNWKKRQWHSRHT